EQTLPRFAREIHETDPHARVRVVREHAHGIDPLNLANGNERVRAAGRHEAQREPRADLERLVGAHENAELGNVGDVRVQESVPRLAVDGPRHVDALRGAAFGHRWPLGRFWIVAPHQTPLSTAARWLPRPLAGWSKRAPSDRTPHGCGGAGPTSSEMSRAWRKCTLPANEDWASARLARTHTRSRAATSDRSTREQAPIPITADGRGVGTPGRARRRNSLRREAGRLGRTTTDSAARRGSRARSGEWK